MINNLNKVDEWAGIKNSTAQSLSLYSLTLQAEHKIRHLVGSNNLKHLQDQRINSFSCRNTPDRSSTGRFLFWTAVQRQQFMKQSLPAERLHGKPYINLTQPPVGLLDGQMSLLFQIKGGEVGWGEETKLGNHHTHFCRNCSY